ncbi:MAG: 30S ribosomal protein S20 [Chloroflexi bacterium]|nr:30S ribosomal protein S20 [Chloroflexota bacterium]
MANTRSAQKMVLVSERRRLRNKPIRSALKTHITSALKLLQAKDMAQAQEATGRAVSELDRAAQKGVIHPNNAARRKSRLMKKLNAVLAAKPEEKA